MTNPKVFVTAATGKATALAWLEKGFPVRDFVCRDDSSANALEDAGAEWAFGARRVEL